VKGLSMAAIGLLLAVAVGYGGGLFWIFDVFANFQIQYLLIGAVVLMLALMLRQWRTATFAVAALVLGALTIFQVPKQEEAGIAAAVPALKVASFNVLFNNSIPDVALKFADAEQPDIIVFQEFTKSFLPSLEKLRERYPYQAVFPLKSGGTDVVMISRLPLIDPKMEAEPERRIRIVTAGVEIEGRRVQIIGLHPPVPLLPRLAEIRDRHFQIVTELVNASPYPVIVIGDFNATLWSAPLRRLFAQTSLRAHTHWPDLTYASVFPWPLRIPIDHVLLSPGLRIVEFRKTNRFGSDHFPIVARIEALSR
jgi:endonuclease/exonuclease/phosphatase (EEP) superfamily protein YafD